MVAKCGHCELPCPVNAIKCAGNCKKWLHYACTNLPPYFLLVLEKETKSLYFCETCTLLKYQNAPIAVGKIETAIESQKQLATSGEETNTETTNQTNTNETDEDHHDEGEEETKKRICVHFAQGKCRYGKQGEQCKYRHPEMCRKFIKDGVYGCKKGLNCNYFHPKLCRDSITYYQCNRRSCGYYHLVGTMRPNAGGSNDYNNYAQQQNYDQQHFSDATASQQQQPNNQISNVSASNNCHDHSQNPSGDHMQNQDMQQADKETVTTETFLEYMKQVDAQFTMIRDLLKNQEVAQKTQYRQQWVQTAHPQPQQQHQMFFVPQPQGYNMVQ